MTIVKNVSKAEFSWGHFGVIIFHLIIGISLLWFWYKRPSDVHLNRWLLIFGVLLTLLSILSLIPIFMYYDKDYQYIIDMN